MKQLVIIGAGGMGRTLYSSALESIGFNEVFEVKGFVDDDLRSLDDFEGYPPIIGAIKDYKPVFNDIFISSIGGNFRNICMDIFISRGAVFFNLIHKTVRIYMNAKIGKGNFIGAYSVIGNDVTVGDYNMIQSYTVIGHDAKIGSYNRIDTHVTCVGGTVVEDNANIHTSAVINHGVTIGTGAHVGALSFVIRKVKPGTTVCGNPAKKMIY